MEKQESMQHSQIGFWITLVIFSLAGIFLILFSTKNYGVGVSSDSISYFNIADHFLSKEQISEIIQMALSDHISFESIKIHFRNLFIKRNLHFQNFEKKYEVQFQ